MILAKTFNFLFIYFLLETKPENIENAVLDNKKKDAFLCYKNVLYLSPMILAKKFHNFLFKFLFEIEPEFIQNSVVDKKKSLSLLKKIGFFKRVNPSIF